MNCILDRIDRPEDLQPLTVAELGQLAGEIRTAIIDTVSRTGGHLAANLGVVELTLGLLRTFRPPADKIVWDVSHQTYAWKILTGRKDRFGTLRQHGGLSGFARREESEYDAFGAGHAGTALSAALGLAAARDRRGGAEHVVAILGDGALGCGLSFEALNNATATTGRLIVILNDNKMSISANVGATARYLGRLLANPRYNRWKGSIEGAARRLRLGWFRHIYFRVEEALKSLFLRSSVFEEFGFRYIGPIDGHDLNALLDALAVARDYGRPILLHVVTQKGRGYAPAEAHPEDWHGKSGFDVETGDPLVIPGAATYSQVFGSVLERLAEKDDRIVAITAAMGSGTGLNGFARRFPNRFFDVGICEQHAVTFAAGLAAAGMRPVFAVYSTFAQRAVDGIIHDVCLQNLPVILCLDRAGLVGDDGPTHHGVFDVALLGGVPNLVFAQPRDEAELANLLFSALRWARPVAIRYPRGAGPGTAIPDTFSGLPAGIAEVVRDGRDVQIWALGDMVPIALAAAGHLAAQGCEAGVVNARFIRPLDERLIEKHAGTARVVVTLENGVIRNGFGAALESALHGCGYAGHVVKFGWPDAFVTYGGIEALMAEAGLTAEAVAAAVRHRLRG